MSNEQEIFNQLKNLTQYRNKSKNELWSIVKQKAKEQDVEITSRFTTASERKIAKQLLHKYIYDFSIETVSDRNTLAELIYFEVIQKRLQEKMNDMYDTDKAVPINFLDVMHRNSDTVVKLKQALGIDKSKEKKHGYDALQHLRKRHEAWMRENRACREFKCPYCQKMTLLRIRTDIYDAQRHPFFKDGRLFNKALFKNMNQTVVINEDFIAEVLETSPNYVTWMIKNEKKEKMRETQKIIQIKYLKEIPAQKEIKAQEEIPKVKEKKEETKESVPEIKDEVPKNEGEKK